MPSFPSLMVQRYEIILKLLQFFWKKFQISVKIYNLRDALIERLREAGVEVNTDWQEGERVLAEQNGKARLMGSRTDKKKAEIAEILNNP